MRSQEFTLSWSNVMKANAAVASRHRASSDTGVVLGRQAGGWDPFEVWLSRIKKPRDRAAMSLTAGFSDAASGRPE
jgi:hypothetical protein